jgi:hypothetical protein
VPATSKERSRAQPVEGFNSTGAAMTGDLTLRLATFAFLVVIFIYAFAINL